MNTDIYALMQLAVDQIPASEHTSSKVAATLTGQDSTGADFVVSSANFWPPAIREHIGIDARVGNSSGTIHAETACILKAPITEKASLFVTDPPCPNCAKNIAEAGIAEVYIDHKGFDKDFAARRGHHFESMTLRIFEVAGVNVYRCFRKERRIEAIYEKPADYRPALENPARVKLLEEDPSDALFQSLITGETAKLNMDHFALVIAGNAEGQFYSISAKKHPVAGFTSQTMEEPEGKYSFLLQPLNRVVMHAARLGLKIDPAYVYASRVPTSRELVNMVGANLRHITLGDTKAARDEDAREALRQLSAHHIIEIEEAL